MRLNLINKRSSFSDYTITIDYLSKFLENEKEFFTESDNEEVNSPLNHPINKDHDQEILSQILSDLTDVNNLLAVEKIETHSPPHMNMQQTGSIPDSKIFLLKAGNQEASNLIQSNNSIAILHNLMKKKDRLQQFIYIGRKFICKDDGKKLFVLEIYARIKENVCELIINDITKKYLYNGLQRFIIQTGQYLHDFKNPLVCINEEINELKIHNDYLYSVLFNSLETNKNEMIDTYFTTTETFEYLSKITEYCRGMIASYEDFSRFIFKPRDVRISKEKIDLQEIFSFIDSMMKFKICKSNKNVEFILLPNSCDRKIICNDKIKLKQVLINILSNSEKFTSIGSITLSANEEVINHKKFIKFLIKDTGIGMSKSVIDSLFTPFYSLNSNNLNKEGCGLGLLIVKQLTEKMGIGLTISSVPGEGTQMWFYAEYFREYDVSPKNGEMNQNQINLCISNNSFHLTKAINSGDKDNLIANENNTKPLDPIGQNFTIQEQESENNVNDTLKVPCYNTERQYSGKFLPNIDKPFAKSLTARKKVQEQTFFEEQVMTESSVEKSPKFRERNIQKFDSKALKVSQTYSFTYQPQIILFAPRKAFEISSPIYQGKKGESIRKIKSHISMNQCKLSSFDTLLKTAQESNTNYSDISKQFLMEHQDVYDSFFKKRRLTSMKSITNCPKATIGSLNDNLNQPSNDGTKDEFLVDIGSIIINVLIIDDDDKIRNCTKKIFQKIEKNEKKYMFRIDEADDGFRGLIKIIEKNLNHSEKYDIIILDDEMNYLNGTDLFKLLVYFTENNIGAKSNFDMNIISRILICSGDPQLVKNKVRISEDSIFCKPLNQNFMSTYVRKIFEV